MPLRCRRNCPAWPALSRRPIRPSSVSLQSSLQRQHDPDVRWPVCHISVPAVHRCACAPRARLRRLRPCATCSLRSRPLGLCSPPLSLSCAPELRLRFGAQPGERKLRRIRQNGIGLGKRHTLKPMRAAGPEGEKLGCFEETMTSGAKLLPTRLNAADDPAMSPQKCRQLAAAAGLTLYGMSGPVCYGSNAQKLPASAIGTASAACGAACPGAAAEVCGGSAGRLSVYLRVALGERGGTPPPPNALLPERFWDACWFRRPCAAASPTTGPFGPTLTPSHASTPPRSPGAALQVGGRAQPAGRRLLPQLHLRRRDASACRPLRVQRACHHLARAACRRPLRARCAGRLAPRRWSAGSCATLRYSGVGRAIRNLLQLLACGVVADTSYNESRTPSSASNARLRPTPCDRHSQLHGGAFHAHLWPGRMHAVVQGGPLRMESRVQGAQQQSRLPPQCPPPLAPRVLGFWSSLTMRRPRRPCGTQQCMRLVY